MRSAFIALRNRRANHWAFIGSDKNSLLRSFPDSPSTSPKSSSNELVHRPTLLPLRARFHAPGISGEERRGVRFIGIGLFARPASRLSQPAAGAIAVERPARPTQAARQK